MKPPSAPACYAAASIFGSDSTVCQSCVAFVPCAAASLETLEAIRGVINVEDLMKRHAAARKVAQGRMAVADEKFAAEAPPGNGERPVVTKPVERKTAIVKVKFEMSEAEDQVLARMPVKAREVALRMVRADDVITLRKALSEGRNHYAEKGPAFMRVAIDMLLHGGFSKRSLRERLERELGWTDASAASHVGIVCAIVVGFKVAKETKGNFALLPA